nr:D-tyrosyl-tRNA(Tyr) deacylase [candidate division Zixibacteria bacterium]
MRLLLQRVNRASVTVDNRIVGEIGHGFLILAGFRAGDDEVAIPRLADKCLNLRVFEDEQGKMNRSLQDVGGQLLVISQFTLYADCRKGRRPSFTNSLPPEPAEHLYNLLLDEFEKSGLTVERGIFGAKMDISLINNGPVTILLDDREI